MPEDLSDLRYQIALANRLLTNEGVLDAFGHVSMRHPTDPGRYLLSRSRSPGVIEADDILEFTLDSEPVMPPTVQLYAERVIHGCIYQARPEVTAVCHHHAPAVMPFCIAGVPIVPVFHLGAAGGEAMPFWNQRDEFGDSNLLVVKPEEGRSLARALGPHAAVLMNNHGATVVGRDLRELVSRSIFMCHNAEYQLRAQILGKVTTLTAGRQARRNHQRHGHGDQPDLGILDAAPRQGRRDASAGRGEIQGAVQDGVQGAAARRIGEGRPVGYNAVAGQEGQEEPEERKSTMKSRTAALATIAVLAPLTLAAIPASAEDQLKVAIGQINNWENQAPTLGQDAGIFKKHNLVLENVGTQGAGETMQPVISGSADLGAGVGVAGALRAFARGAPVRILLPAFTGTGDLFWYVKADSPLKTVKDVTASNTIAYSTSGSSSNNLVLAFADELGVKAKPTATGGPPGTLTQVMSGQIDIGWAAPPFGMKELKEGKIRILIRGSDVPSLRGQTVRTIIVNADALNTKKDAIMRFVQAYREAVDWMYADPKAIKLYAEKMKLDETLIADSIKEFHPKEAMQTDEMKDMDGIQRDAVKLKFIDAPLSKERLAEFIQIPPRKK